LFCGCYSLVVSLTLFWPYFLFNKYSPKRRLGWMLNTVCYIATVKIMTKKDLYLWPIANGKNKFFVCTLRNCDMDFSRFCYCPSIQFHSKTNFLKWKKFVFAFKTEITHQWQWMKLTNTLLKFCSLSFIPVAISSQTLNTG
jgi:hypothetical protein